jgi:hypothetical protein
MVEIIPRKVEEDKWQRVLLYSSIFLSVVLSGAYFLLDDLGKKSEIYVEELEARIAKERTAERIALEQENFDYKKKIEAVTPFLEAHVLGSKFFEFLEDNTHPRIFFSKFNLSIEEAKVILSGKTDSFSTLEQQLSVFNQNPVVEGMSLTRVSLNKEGGIDFDLEIFLNETIFKY